MISELTTAGIFRFSRASETFPDQLVRLRIPPRFLHALSRYLNTDYRNVIGSRDEHENERTSLILSPSGNTTPDPCRVIKDLKPRNETNMVIDRLQPVAHTLGSFPLPC